MDSLTYHQPQVSPLQGSSCLNSSLPWELLAHIFEVGAMDHRNRSDSLDVLSATASHMFPPTNWRCYVPIRDPRHGFRFQLLVSHVCRHWRTVAVSTPTLWNVITLDSTAPWLYVSPQLARSGSAPLDIYIDWEPKHLGVDKATFDSVCSQLVAHVHRWRSVTISGCCRGVELLLNAISEPSTPTATQLTSLQIRQVLYYNIYDPMSSALFGGSLPCLTTLLLWGLPVNWEDSWISVAPNLRDLTLCATGYQEEARLSWTQFIAILRGAPKLESLCLVFFSIDPEPLPPVPVPRLTQLALMCTDQTFTIALLRGLYLPALKCLTLALRSADFTEFAVLLTGPATSHTPYPSGERPHSLLSRLEQFNMIQLECIEHVQEPLYDELRNVRSLSIPRPAAGRYSTFLKLLVSVPCISLGQYMTVRVPRLERLHITMPVHDLQLVCEVVKTRRKAGVPIQALHLIRPRTNETTPSMREKWNREVEWLRQHVEVVGIVDWE